MSRGMAARTQQEPIPKASERNRDRGMQGDAIEADRYDRLIFDN